MSNTFLHKQQLLTAQFAHCSTPDLRYQKIMELGKTLAPFPTELRIPENLVRGCQSQLYLHAFAEKELIHFLAASDALISAGLAALLLAVYSGETAEVILKEPPTFLNTIEVANSLSPNRSNGLYSLHLKMKQEALRLLMASKKT